MFLTDTDLAPVKRRTRPHGFQVSEYATNQDLTFFEAQKSQRRRTDKQPVRNKLPFWTSLGPQCRHGFVSGALITDMNQRLSHSFAGRYLAFAFLGYLIVGSSGLNENAIMVTNALSYWFVVDPYLFVWILGLPISAVLSGRTGPVHFDHMSQTMMSVIDHLNPSFSELDLRPFSSIQ
jgi:hypothetical protein